MWHVRMMFQVHRNASWRMYDSENENFWGQAQEKYLFLVFKWSTYMAKAEDISPCSNY